MTMMHVHRHVHEQEVLWHEHVLQTICNHCSMIMKTQRLLIFQCFAIVEYLIDHQFMTQTHIHGNGCVYEFCDERILFVSMMLGHVAMVSLIHELIQYRE